MMIYQMALALSLVLAVSACQSRATLTASGDPGDAGALVYMNGTQSTGKKGRSFHSLRDPYGDPDLIMKDLYR